MKRLISTRSVAAAAIVLGAFAAASAAHARSDVYFSIGLQSPGVYVQPAPVYVQPQPVYVHPQPVYVQPAPRYYGGGHSSHTWDRRGPYGDYDRDGIANVYDRDNRGYGNQRHGRRFGPHGDLDRDGVPNRYDRDMDGDGVRNRRDSAPANPRYR